jgi:hypothetical protein
VGTAPGHGRFGTRLLPFRPRLCPHMGACGRCLLCNDAAGSHASCFQLPVSADTPSLLRQHLTQPPTPGAIAVSSLTVASGRNRGPAPLPGAPRRVKAPSMHLLLRGPHRWPRYASQRRWPPTAAPAARCAGWARFDYSGMKSLHLYHVPIDCSCPHAYTCSGLPR